MYRLFMTSLFFSSSGRVDTAIWTHYMDTNKTIKIRQTRHCWRIRDDLISDVLLWTPSHGRAKAG